LIEQGRGRLKGLRAPPVVYTVPTRLVVTVHDMSAEQALAVAGVVSAVAKAAGVPLGPRTTAQQCDPEGRDSFVTDYSRPNELGKQQSLVHGPGFRPLRQRLGHC